MNDRNHYDRENYPIVECDSAKLQNGEVTSQGCFVYGGKSTKLAVMASRAGQLQNSGKVY